MVVVSAVALLVLFSPRSLIAQGDRGTVVVEITGFRNSGGQAGVLLFSRQNGFPGDHRLAVRKSFAAIDRNTCRVTLENIPYGTYAVSVFHDENADGELDKNIFGIPREGVGASRNPAVRFGPPKFEEARFALDSQEQRLAITLHYLNKQRLRQDGGKGAGQ
jgi:uncharacterized protein (DUF2141 family)